MHSFKYYQLNYFILHLAVAGHCVNDIMPVFICTYSKTLNEDEEEKKSLSLWQRHHL